MIEFSKINESYYRIYTSGREETKTISDLTSAKIPNVEFTPAYRAGLTDGRKRFSRIVLENEIIVPRGLLEPIINFYSSQGTELENPESLDPIDFEEFKAFVKSLNIPFEPYDYQIQAAYDSIRNKIQTNVMATGSGKSLTIYLLLRYFLETIPEDKKIVIIVPSIMLLSQMVADFESYGFTQTEELIRRVGGDYKVKEFDKKIVITTYQSLSRNPQMFQDVEVLIEDEIQVAKSEVHENILFPCMIYTPRKYGFTGTLPKDKCHRMSIASVFGKSKTYVTARQLINRGLLTDMDVTSIFLEHTIETRSVVKNVKTYAQELAYILSLNDRTEVIARICKKLSTKGNTLVLFNRVEFGKELAKSVMRHKFGLEDYNVEELRKLNEYDIFFISGDSTAKDREIIRQILEEKKEAIIIATTSLMSTGINIKNLHNLVLTTAGKSAITINQSIGRMLRKHQSKDKVNLYDIIDNACHHTRKNYLYKHYIERVAIYNENEYKIKEMKIIL